MRWVFCVFDVEHSILQVDLLDSCSVGVVRASFECIPRFNVCAYMVD